MNIFKRLLKIGQAEIHALVDKMENPIRLIENGIEEMKQQLSELTEAYILNRAQIIRNENLAKNKLNDAESYEAKAVLLLQKAQKQEIESSKADHLALEALNIKKKLTQEATEVTNENLLFAEKTNLINNKIDILKFNIAKWEKELSTLKAKQRINNASEFANQQMANIDNNSTIELLKKMKLKLQNQEAHNDATEEIIQLSTEQQIDYLLDSSDNTAMQDLEQLKQKIKNL
ncbi:PspA/IM30 family protein [Sphingobacterium bovistauri]|uniref:PspA/IM30 family protein n=1 Tax=Sphingobacterium bovistauri TaxID=2781959 RepID=A0ABS7Z2M8_9SPHI|nr:PspA/IM30 family protein [Sphingobacterium bovistauri]MCA5004425.1 PspA/IM30 family protein [Sphingobacterium bovistauri]